MVALEPSAPHPLLASATEPIPFYQESVELHRVRGHVWHALRHLVASTCNPLDVFLNFKPSDEMIDLHKLHVRNMDLEDESAGPSYLRRPGRLRPSALELGAGLGDLAMLAKPLEWEYTVSEWDDTIGDMASDISGLPFLKLHPSDLQAISPSTFNYVLGMSLLDRATEDELPKWLAGIRGVLLPGRSFFVHFGTTDLPPSYAESFVQKNEHLLLLPDDKPVSSVNPNSGLQVKLFDRAEVLQAASTLSPAGRATLDQHLRDPISNLRTLSFWTETGPALTKELDTELFGRPSSLNTLYRKALGDQLDAAGFLTVLNEEVTAGAVLDRSRAHGPVDQECNIFDLIRSTPFATRAQVPMPPQPWFAEPILQRVRAHVTVATALPSTGRFPAAHGQDHEEALRDSLPLALSTSLGRPASVSPPPFSFRAARRLRRLLRR
eukprot:NODE_359_length_1438_cov_100.840893_g263_i0.p1 GENE.NODE_359_length_1438_cov_100.840893_g263_i0~~NODE_359_length_1438_cov_100.840893_g263_i0.p1  ORF type:complete len:464 (-),score=145.75 NODE_359_length_1438_cov_100.840893_g263_i0:45-1355(-)